MKPLWLSFHYCIWFYFLLTTSTCVAFNVCILCTEPLTPLTWEINVLNLIYYACFYFFWHLWHEYQIMYVYCVQSTHLFAHNFLNIKPIFNLTRILENWDLGLFNHIIKSDVCQSMLKVLKVIFDLWHLRRA